MFYEPQSFVHPPPADSQSLPNPASYGFPQNELSPVGAPVSRMGELNVGLQPVIVRVPNGYSLRNGYSPMFSTAGVQGEQYAPMLGMQPSLVPTNSFDRMMNSGAFRNSEKIPAQHMCVPPQMPSYTQQANMEGNRRNEKSFSLKISTADNMGQESDVKTVKVFDTDFQNLLTIPIEAVLQFPPAKKNITRWVLCRNYQEGLREKENPDTLHAGPLEHVSGGFTVQSSARSAASGTIRCAMGPRCNFVHVDIEKYRSQITTHRVHINYVWAKPYDCCYPRLSPGLAIKIYERVFSSGSSLTSTKDGYSCEPMEIDSGSIIYTAAFSNSHNAENGLCAMDSPFDLSFDRVFRQCEQFHGYSYCPLADQCKDVHVMHIDPSKNSGDHKWVRPRLKTGKRHMGVCPTTPLSSTISGVSSFVPGSPFNQGYDNARRGQEAEVAGPLMSRGSDAPPVVLNSHPFPLSESPPAHGHSASDNMPGMRGGNPHQSESPYKVIGDSRPLSFPTSVAPAAIITAGSAPSSGAAAFSPPSAAFEGPNSNFLGPYSELYNRFPQNMFSQGPPMAHVRDLQIPPSGAVPALPNSHLGNLPTVPLSYSSSSASFTESRGAPMISPTTVFSTATPQIPASLPQGQDFFFFKSAEPMEYEKMTDCLDQNNNNNNDEDDMIELLTGSRMGYGMDSEFTDD